MMSWKVWVNHNAGRRGLNFYPAQLARRLRFLLPVLLNLLVMESAQLLGCLVNLVVPADRGNDWMLDVSVDPLCGLRMAPDAGMHRGELVVGSRHGWQLYALNGEIILALHIGDSQQLGTLEMIPSWRTRTTCLWVAKR